MLRSVPGTFDLLPQGQPLSEPAFRAIVQAAEAVLQASGAIPVATPILEYAELFQRGVGVTSDIVVRKEMYTLSDRGERLLALRPEPTAALVRAYHEHGMKVWPQPVRLYTYGPIFRAERHQRGRYRQFHQIDYEALGLSDPLLDAEAIALMVRIYQHLGLRQLEVRLASLGDPADRQRYNAYLRELLAPHAERLSPESQSRLELNPLRILDSKSDTDQALLEELSPEPLSAFLGPAAQAFQEAVERYLKALGIPFVYDPKLVRGLDYYVRTAWEVHHQGVGAKSALGGGGRYDGLSEMLGAGPLPGVGFGIGIERLALALSQEGWSPPAPPRPDLIVAPLDDEARLEALRLAEALRPEIRVELLYTPRAPGKALEEALKRKARFIAFLGSEERAKGELTLRDLDRGEQRSLSLSQLREHLAVTHQA
jgi:histidyl-tRNA synthetase